MKKLIYSLFLMLTVACMHKTSTPKEFINENIIPLESYKKDLSLLKDGLRAHYDSINSTVSPSHVIKVLNIEIDTVFYGTDNKIAFMALLTKRNEYAKGGIQYAGECYIAYKKDKIDNLYQLKYSSTSTTSLKEVSGMIRKIYLREMNHVVGKYNINDTRFWNSGVWKEAEGMKEKWRSFEKLKKSIPNNVYDPNERE